MCLLRDRLNLDDYREIEGSVPREGRVFIGSDADIYLKKKEIRFSSVYYY